MAGIAGDECAPDAKVLRHAMLHTIGREPIHISHAQTQQVLEMTADIVKSEVLAARMLGRHDPDQTQHPAAPNRKGHAEFIGGDGEVDVAIEHGAGGGYVGHEKFLVVDSTRKLHAQSLAHRAVAAVASADEAEAAGFVAAFLTQDRYRI